MWGLGFGLERIGVAALARPVLSSILIVISLLISMSFLGGIRFDGNVISVLPKDSAAFQNYANQKKNFRNFSRDIAVIVRSPRLNTASGLEDLRFLQLETAITEGVSSALSMFSIPNPDPETGALNQFFPDIFADDAQAKALVARLIKDHPQARSLISPADQAAIIFVTLDVGLQGGGDREAYAAFKTLKDAVNHAAPEDFEVHYAGLTPIGLTIIDALISDQVRLTVIGLILGAAIALVVFRSVIAAVICGIPPTLTAVWALGVFGMAGIPVTYLTTVLPTLALILAYADGIVLYYRWHRSNAESEDRTPEVVRGNLIDAIWRVGPASSLTSITTAIAFFSFSIASSDALVEFAWLGVAAVGLAFLSVIVGLPIAGHWAIKSGLIKFRKPRREHRTLGSWATLISSKFPVWISLTALVVIGGLIFVHFLIRPEYRVTDYLPIESESYQAESVVNDVFGGRSFVFMSVPVANSGRLSSLENRERLKDVEAVLSQGFAESQIFSLHSIWKGLASEAAINKVARELEAAPPQTRRGYLSQDGSEMLVSVRIPSDQSITETLTEIKEIRALLGVLEFGDDIKITGFPVLMAEEFTKLIGQLRNSLMLAIACGVLMIGIATRSPLIALAVLTPNLFPILFIEFLLYLRGGLINMSEVIALTLAFGIAIDNAVHVVNVFQAEQRTGKDMPTALRDALYEVGPALGASTIIICVSSMVTLTSALPFIPVLGQLIIAILIVALFANLIILPANLLTLRLWTRRQD